MLNDNCADSQAHQIAEDSKNLADDTAKLKNPRLSCVLLDFFFSGLEVISYRKGGRLGYVAYGNSDDDIASLMLQYGVENAAQQESVSATAEIDLRYVRST
jgi:hypothetical protein